MVPSSIPSKSCQDYDGGFGASGKLTCAKIREFQTQEKRCKKQKIYELCPITCGICCKDDPNYTSRYKKEKRNCAWLASENSNGQIDKLCEEYGASIQYGCIATCGYCYPFPFPTLSPSME